MVVMTNAFLAHPGNIKDRQTRQEIILTVVEEIRLGEHPTKAMYAKSESKPEKNNPEEDVTQTQAQEEESPKVDTAVEEKKIQWKEDVKLPHKIRSKQLAITNSVRQRRLPLHRFVIQQLEAKFSCSCFLLIWLLFLIWALVFLAMSKYYL